jgi:Mrp family chromosome partitioning ATPase
LKSSQADQLSTPPNPIHNEQGARAPYLRAIRSHLLLVIAIVVVAVVGALAYEKTRQPSYEASSQVLVTAVTNSSAYVGLPVITESSIDPSRMLETATSVLKSPAVALSTANQLHGAWTQQTVTEGIEIQPLGETNILSVTGTAESATEAATLANAYAGRALALHREKLSGEAKAELEQLEAQRRSGGGVEVSQIAALTALTAGRDPNFSLLQEAAPPTSASGSSKKLLILLALLAGLIIGTGAATAIDFLNRNVRDEEELLSLYPLPILSRIPSLPRGTRDAVSFALIPPRVREAFRTLQVQLPLTSSSRGRAVMFTSASPRDGKTASAVNFALVLAAAGFRVVLFDFDIRKPEIAERLGTGSEHPDFLRADVTLGDLLVPAPSAPGLWVVGAHRHADVTPLLDTVGHRLQLLLEEAREVADYIVVDTPPLGQVSDALRVSMLVDDVALIVRTASTNRDELKHTRELLERMALVPAGLLVIGDVGSGSDIYAEYGRASGDEQALAAREEQELAAREEARSGGAPERPPTTLRPLRAPAMPPFEEGVQDGAEISVAHRAAKAPVAEPLREEPSVRPLRQAPSVGPFRQAPSVGPLRQPQGAAPLRQTPSVAPLRDDLVKLATVADRAAAETFARPQENGASSTATPIPVAEPVLEPIESGVAEPIEDVDVDRDPLARPRARV